MKRLTFAAFVAFWTFFLTVLALAALAPDVKPGAAAVAPRRYSLADVAVHRDAESCWLAIEGKVYDVTNYLENHPAPASVLPGWCGREATEGMRTKGYGRDHSAAAWARLDELYIGDLR